MARCPQPNIYCKWYDFPTCCLLMLAWYPHRYGTGIWGGLSSCQWQHTYSSRDIPDLFHSSFWSVTFQLGYGVQIFGSGRSKHSCPSPCEYSFSPPYFSALGATWEQVGVWGMLVQYPLMVWIHWGAPKLWCYIICIFQLYLLWQIGCGGLEEAVILVHWLFDLVCLPSYLVWIFFAGWFVSVSFSFCFS